MEEGLIKIWFNNIERRWKMGLIKIWFNNIERRWKRDLPKYGSITLREGGRGTYQNMVQ